MRKKSKEDEQNLEEWNSARRRSQAKCQLVQTSYIKRIKLFLFFFHIINILLTELSRSVWENLDLGRVYRPHYVRSVLTTSIKILPYRPPARLIRANYSRDSCKNALLRFTTWKEEMLFWSCLFFSIKQIIFCFIPRTLLINLQRKLLGGLGSSSCTVILFTLLALFHWTIQTKRKSKLEMP